MNPPDGKRRGRSPRSWENIFPNESVNIGMISTSEIKISVTIDLAKGEQAIKAVHKAFIG